MSDDSKIKERLEALSKSTGAVSAPVTTTGLTQEKIVDALSALCVQTESANAKLDTIIKNQTKIAETNVENLKAIWDRAGATKDLVQQIQNRLVAQTSSNNLESENNESINEIQSSLYWNNIFLFCSLFIGISSFISITVILFRK